jgi:ethanolamine utilization microcompartment shell protein EutS
MGLFDYFNGAVLRLGPFGAISLLVRLTLSLLACLVHFLITDMQMPYHSLPANLARNL